MNTQNLPYRWQQRAFRAMGCQMSIWLDMEDAIRADDLLRESEAMFRRAEAVLSRFDPASELTRLNQHAGRWVTVSDLLWAVLYRAIYMARETGGLFDPTQLTALEAAGYTVSFDALPADVTTSADPVISEYGQWTTVRLDAARQAVWMPRGVRIDLGGIAKGFTAQQVVDHLAGEGAALVDASGDLTAGAAPEGWPGWPVAVRAPFSDDDDPDAELFPLWLVDGTVATSGIDFRRWRHNGRPAHHIIDPRTGQPAQTDLVTATVLARKAVRAEAWATAALVAGSIDALPQLTDLGLAATLVDHDHHLTLTPALTSVVAAVQEPVL